MAHTEEAPSASSPTCAGNRPADSRLLSAEYVKKVSLCIAYIATSAVLIRFNKFLMTEDRFPFPMALTAIHMMMSSLLCLVMYFVAPSLFPGLQLLCGYPEKPRGMVNTAGQRAVLLQWFIPIGIVFAISLFASNAAYRYCSVSFLQFMKEGNVIIAFAMSCVAGLQTPSRVRLAVILWVMGGSAMAVTGEVHFVFIGFAFQIVSQVAECARAVMGESVLRGAGLKLDPLSYTMFVAPTCLAVLIVGNVFTWSNELPRHAVLWWRYLLPNALLAFLLNVCVASVIKEVSAVGFMLTGMVKDIVVVLFSCAEFGEVVTVSQLVGFAVALAGVFLWSYLKVSPDSPVACFAEVLLGGPRRVDAKLPASETTPLMPECKP